MTKLQHQELAEQLYERTVDFLNVELVEMLYETNTIEDTGSDAIHLANKVMYEFFNKHLTKNW